MNSSISKKLMYFWIVSLIVSVILMIIAMVTLNTDESLDTAKGQGVLYILSSISWVIFILTFLGWLISLFTR